MKKIQIAICVVSLGAALSANATVTITGSDLAGLSLNTPGPSATSTYSATSAGGNPGITLYSPDNVGGGAFPQFTDTANLTVINGYLGVNLGTLSQFIAAGASFNLYSATLGGDQGAYWDVDVDIGGTTYQINAYGDNVLGANTFPANASGGYSVGGTSLGFTFGSTWAYLVGLYGADNVTAVTVDVGGWDTALVGGQTDVISSITLPGTYTPVPETTTMFAGAMLLLPFGASTLRMLRRKQTA